MLNHDIAAPSASLLQPRVQCEEIASPLAFASLEADYRALYDRSSRATIYQNWTWIHRWWLTFGSRSLRLCILAFRQDGRLVGCAPLVVRRPAGLPLRRLEPIGVLRSDYMDLLIEDGCESVVLQAFEEHLRQSRSWDLLDLQQLPEDSPTLAYFRAREMGPECVIREQEVCPYAPLPETWEQFLKGLGKKNRYNVGYYRRLAERDFSLEIRRVGRDEFDSSMEELYRLHQLRWRKRKLPGALFSASVREFHRRVASDLLDASILDLYRMDLNGKAVALLYCFSEKGRGYYYLGGFDPDYSRYSVGTVLTAHAIQQSIARGHSVFDFLRGDEPYKYRWNVQEKKNYRMEWLRGNPGSRALYGLNQATRAIEHQAKVLARRMERYG